MRPRALLVPLLLALMAAPVTSLSPASVPANAAAEIPVLREIRAAHHPGFDRIVFEFEGPLPEHLEARWVERVTQDGSGRPVRIQGNAFILVTMFAVRAHAEAAPFPRTYGPARRAFALPNIAHVVNAGDFEAVVSFGIGLMRRTKILRTLRLVGPSRFVIDVATSFRRETVSAFLVDSVARGAGTPPYVKAVPRPVPRAGIVKASLMRLFAGPTAEERAQGLRLVPSGATGFRGLRVSPSGVARVELTGRCDSRGSDLTIASQIMPTLKQHPGIEWVKILDPQGRTQRPWGRSDSVPACLEP
jgi:hypothetical protein